MKSLLVSIVLVCCGTGCRSEAGRIERLERDPALAELLIIQDADPRRACANAWARGERRFLGIMGANITVPGIDVIAYETLVYDKQGIRVIEGTTDFGVDERLQKLIDGATRYAEQYNECLLERIMNASSARSPG